MKFIWLCGVRWASGFIFFHLDIFPIAIKYHWIVHSFPTNLKLCFYYILNTHVFRDKFQDCIFLLISASELCITKYCTLYVSFVTIGKNNKNVFLLLINKIFIITNEIIFIILIFHDIQVFSIVIIFQVRGIYLEHLFRSSFMFVKVVYFLINLIYKK